MTPEDLKQSANFATDYIHELEYQSLISEDDFLIRDIKAAIEALKKLRKSYNISIELAEKWAQNENVVHF